MTEKALGVIETMGLVPAIEAADTGLKTANITLDGLEMVGAGLVAILMRGDVSSVKAAVEAGAQAASRLGKVISTTVIARTAEGLECIITPENAACDTVADEQPTPPAGATTAVIDSHDSPDVLPAEEFKLMSVVKLRAFARTLKGYSLTREEIRSARKQNLIENILKYYREKGLSHD